MLTKIFSLDEHPIADLKNIRLRISRTAFGLSERRVQAFCPKIFVLKVKFAAPRLGRIANSSFVCTCFRTSHVSNFRDFQKSEDYKIIHALVFSYITQSQTLSGDRN